MAGASTADRRGGDLLQRPLTARSIVASLLLGMHPPRQSSARLVRWCALFGITENATRVALSRMVERGELTAVDGIYELAGAVRRRQAPQDWALDPQLVPWQGDWVQAVVTAERRPATDRVALRAAAQALRLGELRESIWCRPANLSEAAAPADARALVDSQCLWWTGRPQGDPAGLAERLFALRSWAQRAEHLLSRIEPLTAAIPGGAEDVLNHGFVVGAAVLQHLRHDPLLPDALLPSGWPGNRLRAAYAGFQAVFGRAAAAYLR